MQLFGKIAIGLTFCCCGVAQAQISLSSAVDLALRNSPKVKLAQADLAKAQAVLSESKDVYIPAVSTSGGDGKSTGVPLGLPVVFSVSAQSLAFNFSQRDFIRSASAGVDAAKFSVAQAQNDVAEDAAYTYVALDNASQRKQVMSDALSAANKLVTIVQARYDAGAEAHIEVSKSKQSLAQLKLQMLVVEDEIKVLSDHLGRLTGLTRDTIDTVHSSIPEIPIPSMADFSLSNNPGIEAAEATANARRLSAHGDSRYKLRPQVAFEAEYSRITTVGNNYDLYYPGFGPDKDRSLNALGIGIQVTFPLLDYLHAAKARESLAEARRAEWQTETQKMEFMEGHLKLQNSVAELAAQVEVAKYTRDIAQDQLDTVRIQLQPAAGASGATQLSPKDEQNAVLQERQKNIDLLSEELHLSQSELSLMEQNGTLSDWLHMTVTPPVSSARHYLPPSPVPQVSQH